jgi:hypothetical protein
VTNLVTTYPDKLPIDPETLKLEKRDPIAVLRDQNPSFAYWELEEATGGAEEHTRSFENNTTISAGMTVGYVTTDVSTTVGFGGEESQITSWEDSLAIKAGVENFRDSGFKCYDAVPYLYHAKARTLGGTSYPYLALDWYVPRIYPCPY